MTQRAKFRITFGHDFRDWGIGVSFDIGRLEYSINLDIGPFMIRIGLLA